jgi:dipeptide transport system permease protein
MLSRLIYGAQYSLFIGIVVVAIALIGRHDSSGLLAGFFGGWVDTCHHAGHGRDPGVSVASAGAGTGRAVLGPGLTNAMIAIAIVYQPHFARLTRAAVMGEKEREYVTAARVAGAGKLRLMFKTILPNCLAPLIVQATLSFSSAVLDSAALGFPGHGGATAGVRVGHHAGRSARIHPAGVVGGNACPGLAILISVLAINLMGDGLRDALDPKLKRS